MGVQWPVSGGEPEQGRPIGAAIEQVRDLAVQHIPGFGGPEKMGAAAWQLAQDCWVTQENAAGLTQVEGARPNGG
jgi:hypothetical protein